MRIGGILLASGFGRRFGSNKLLAEVDRVPLVQRAFDALPPALFDGAVVTSQYSEILALAAKAGYIALPNPAAAEGISAGIRLGLSQLMSLGVDGALFAVCDQPQLTRESVTRLLVQFRAHPDSIAALAWEGTRGNPVVFPKTLFPALMALTGDRGGAAVLKQHKELLLLVEAGAAAELHDVDTGEDMPPEQSATS